MQLRLWPLLVFAICSIVIPFLAMAQQPYGSREKQVRSLMVNSANAGDYQKLADYFHYQEMVFRAKKQALLNYYATHSGKFTMATKFITRAEVTSRQANVYAVKAEQNAKLAGKFDEMISEAGNKPTHKSSDVVELKSLQNAAGTSSKK